jgi:hypothetical protein
MARGRPRKDQENVLLKSAELIGWALGGLEREIGQTRETLARLTAQAAKLRAHASLKGTAAANGTSTGNGAGVTAAATEPEATGRKRRRAKMSPEARKRISEAMTKRWAEKRKSK